MKTRLEKRVKKNPEGVRKNRLRVEKAKHDRKCHTCGTIIKRGEECVFAGYPQSYTNTCIKCLIAAYEDIQIKEVKK